MRTINSFRPYSSEDTGVVITSTTASTSFPLANLKNIQPTKVYKTTAVNAEQIVNYDFGGNVAYDHLFINRINFAEFYIERSLNNSDWTLVEHVTGMVKDEIYDENYVHRMVEIGVASYRYLRIRIPAQTPLFNPTYFQIGNMLVGTANQIWNPKAGYNVNILPKMAITEFKSGYISVVVLGKSHRVFSGSFDKITMIEFKKIIMTFRPFIMYHEFDSDKTSAYLVRVTKDTARDYTMATIVSTNFSFEEIV